MLHVTAQTQFEGEAHKGVCVRLLETPELQAMGVSSLLPFKDALLLAKLALDGPAVRAKLAPWLWPTATPEGARANLRQRLLRLQKQSGKALLKIEGAQRVELQAGVQVDIHHIEDVLINNCRGAAGDLLGSMSPIDESAAAEGGATSWLASARQELRLLRSRTLWACIQRCEAQNQLRDALSYARRLLDEEPGQDAVLCQVLKFHHALGERAVAEQVWASDKQWRQQQGLPAPGPEALAIWQMLASATPGGSSAQQLAPTAAEVAAILRPPRLIGRANEWTQLHQSWQEGRSVLVLGHAGLGKTRLALELADALGIGLRMAARPGDRLVPYALLGQLAEKMSARAEEMPEWARAELARLWPALGETPAAPLQPLRLLQALRALLVGAPPLFVDDLHFIDEASAELLPSVLEAAPQVLVTCRPEGLPANLATWIQARAQAWTTVSLRAWAESEVHELLSLLALKRFPAAEWTRPLARHTGGHPLLLLSTLQALVRMGQPDPAQPLPVPDVLAPLIAPRLAGLSAGARALALLAACAGDAFDVDLAKACLEGTGADLKQAWRELVAAGLFADGAPLHSLVAEAIALGATEPDLAEVHGRIAEVLTHRDAAPAHLALHWRRAGKATDAACCFELAANLAERRSRRQEEALHWGEAALAWEQTGKLDRAFEARAQQVRTLLNSGAIEAARDQLKTLVARADGAQQRAHVLILQAHADLLAGAYGAAVQNAEEAIRLLAPLRAPLLRRDAALLSAVGGAQLGRYTEAMFRLDEVDAHDQACPPSGDRRLAALSMRGHVLDRVGRIADAMATTERAVKLAIELQELTELQVQQGNLATLQAKAGLGAKAIAQLEQAMALARDLGQDQGLQGAAQKMNLGVIAGTVGRYSLSLKALSEAIDMLRAHDAATSVVYAEHHLAQLWMLLGQPARAMPLLSGGVEALALTTKVRRLCLRGRLKRLCGVTAGAGSWRDMRIGDEVDPQVAAGARLELARVAPPPEALALALDVERWAEAAGLKGATVHARLVALDALIAQAESEEACRRAVDLLREAETHQVPDVYWPELPWAASRAFRQAGRDAEASAALQLAVDWIRAVLLEQVDEKFQLGFKSRNLVNSAVLAAAARHGMKGV